LDSVEVGVVEILGQIELEGRSYSATLVTAVGALLARSGVALADLAAIIAVNGPGSFTGVRVGLSAVKGLAEAAQIPVVAVSRLEVLARNAGTYSAALDAHRGEVFLRVGGPGLNATELLAGTDDLSAIELVICPVIDEAIDSAIDSAIGRAGAPDAVPVAARVGVCDDAAEALLASAWPNLKLVRTHAPTAADALKLCAPRVGAGKAAGEFVDLALLDGHYLRRSDAEIFGEPAGLGLAGVKPA
jgi:tRNA threonylcarbamoyladenosine biosynthesis protein TsaB